MLFVLILEKRGPIFTDALFQSFVNIIFYRGRAIILISLHQRTKQYTGCSTKCQSLKSNKALNNSSACSALFLSTTGLFPNTQKNYGARDAVECSNIFLSAGNNPGVLQNSTEHAEPLFNTFRLFPETSLFTAVHQYGF